MNTPVAVALLLSLLAGFAVAEEAMRPPEDMNAGERMIQAQVGGSSYRRDDRRGRDRDRPRERQQRRGAPVDCHRDVRTHRVNGIMLTHRHVGNDCAIREVRRSN